MFGLGSILGLLGGGVLGGLGLGTSGGRKMLFGQGERERQFQRFTPEQEDVLNQLLQQGSQAAGGTGMEDLARKRFQEETIPSLAERFTSMGAGGQRSSAFQSAIGRAGGDLEAQLASLGQQRGMQQLGMGLTPRFDTGYSPATQGLLGGAAGSIGSTLPLLLQLLGG